MDVTTQPLNPEFIRNTKTFGKRVIVGSFALSLKSIGSQLITTLTNVILARILSPQILGTFIILSFIVSLISFFADIGLTKALVQRNVEPQPLEVQTIFTLHIILAVICMVFIWASAPFIISVYRTQMPVQAILLLRILAVSIPFTALGGISKALLERHLLYNRYAAGEFATLLVSKGLAVILAVAGLGLGSLIVAEVVSRLIGSIVYLCLYVWKFGIYLKLSLLRPFIVFGLPYQISTIINLFQGAVIPFYVALFPGPGTVPGAQASGLLIFAAGVAVFTRFFSEIISQLLFATLARRQYDPVFINKMVERGVFVSALSSFGTGIVIWSWAPEIIMLVYSAKWLPALPALYILLLSSVLFAISTIGTSTLLALGKARSYTNIQLATTIVQWVFTILFVNLWGFVGYALATICAACVSLVAFAYLHISIRDISKKLLLIFISTICTYIIIHLLKPIVNVNNVIKLVFFSGFTAALYLFMLSITIREKILSEVRIIVQTITH